MIPQWVGQDMEPFPSALHSKLIKCAPLKTQGSFIVLTGRPAIKQLDSKSHYRLKSVEGAKGDENKTCQGRR